MDWKSLLPFLLLQSGSFSQAENAFNPNELRDALRRGDPTAAHLARRLLGPNGGNRLFYFPTKSSPNTPATWDYAYESFRFPSKDGTQLHGWFLPARGEAKGTIVFSHGNAGSMGHHLGFVLWLVQAHYHVFMYDYRGFGESAGVVDRRGILDDVEAAFHYVQTLPKVDPTRLISYGHSLGGAKSVTALAEAPVKGLRAVIIDGAFASYQAMARQVAGDMGEELVTDEWAPRNYVGRLAPTPLLVIHGTKDQVVPFSQGNELFEKGAQPKTLFAVKDGQHGDALVRDHGAYRKRMLAWLDDQLKD